MSWSNGGIPALLATLNDRNAETFDQNTGFGIHLWRALQRAATNEAPPPNDARKIGRAVEE
jgi:hypothetical protein